MALFSGIAAFFASVAGAVGFGAAAATAIGATLARLTISIVFSLVSRAFTTKPSIPKQQIQATLNQSAGPRERLYGRGLLGGTRAFWETKSNQLHQIVLMQHGALTSKLDYWLDGAPVVVNASGKVTSNPYDEKIELDWRDGSTDGGDYTDISTEYPTLWTSDHKLTNQATVRAIFTSPAAAQYAKIFPRGQNTNVQIEAEGVAVLDVRTGTTGYSDNAGLCIVDYMTSVSGWRIPQSKIDVGSASFFADLSDEGIPLKGGGAEPRYRLWGVYNLQEDPKSVLGRMEVACGASVYQTAEGKVGIIGGCYSVPDVTITDDDIYSIEKIEGDSALDAFNVLKGIYTSADHGYQDVEAEAWEDAVSLLTNPEESREMYADMCPSHGQMRRLMKEEAARRNRTWRGRMITNLVGLKARFPKGDGVHTIRVQYDELGMDEDVEVLGHTLMAEKAGDGAIIWKCAIDIAQISPGWFAWDADTEEGTAPAVPPPPEGVEATPVPDIEPLSEITLASGSKAIEAIITDISRPDLTLEVQYTDGGFWLSMTITDLRAVSSTIAAVTDYQVRARFQGGEWSATSTITTS